MRSKFSITDKLNITQLMLNNGFKPTMLNICISILEGNKKLVELVLKYPENIKLNSWDIQNFLKYDLKLKKHTEKSIIFLDFIFKQMQDDSLSHTLTKYISKIYKIIKKNEYNTLDVETAFLCSKCTQKYLIFNSSIAQEFTENAKKTATKTLTKYGYLISGYCLKIFDDDEIVIPSILEEIIQSYYNEDIYELKQAITYYEEKTNSLSDIVEVPVIENFWDFCMLQ
ncbi:MAG: hypothetical protein HRU35_07725 [Rickettsiaceae bacterium]|nr:hypothetical protein [Rickettsiaceae bacterium]